MAFLDNSGDIILDAVLTDTGRMRLAKGDGSFKITKFSLGDDEINYQLYRNQNNSQGASPSGSAFYDLSILQTPVLEAFTNNTSILKHRLVSYVRNDLLYLPIIKQNTSKDPNGALFDGSITTIACNTTTAKAFQTSNDAYLNGVNPDGSNYYIRTDFGIDSDLLAISDPLDADLRETQLIVELDNRLGNLVAVTAGTDTDYAFDFLDDDQVATYVLTDAITNIQINNSQETSQTSISGPQQGYAKFRIRASTSLRNSSALFNRFGSTGQTLGAAAGTYSIIDTIMRISGGNTGFSIDIPLRFAKQE